MILITGARGFIGRYLVKELSKLGRPLFLTTGQKYFLESKNGNLLHYLNLTEPESFSNMPDKIDKVIHLAALIPKGEEVFPFEKYVEINALGTQRLMEAVATRNCQKFIYASTQMVIEKPFYLPVDEDHPLVPLSDYGFSKAAGERLCLSLAKKLNMDTISLRFSRIFGAGENPGFVLSAFIELALKGLPLKVYGTGRIQRDLLYVKDAVQAIIKALDADLCGVLNIGSGKGVSIKEMAEAIAEVFSRRRSTVEFDNAAEEGGSDFWLDIRKAERELGFLPKYTFYKGLEDYRSILVSETEES